MKNFKLSQILVYKKKHGWPEVIKQYLRAYASRILPCRFETELGITAIVKNEAPYMSEWIEFHKLVGAGKFYIYDNESTDNLKEVLKPYIDANEVIYKYIKGKQVQNDAYQDSIEKNCRKVRWMAFIDIDEFIVPLKHATIQDFLKSLSNKPDGVGINWVMHGFNGHYEKPSGLVCENFPKCDFSTGANQHIKSIVNPRTVIIANHPHFCVHLPPAKVVNAKGEKMCGPFTGPYLDDILINHYWTKSYEEYTERVKKGKADGSVPVPLDFNPDYLSTDENHTMDRFLDKLREKVN